MRIKYLSGLLIVCIVVFACTRKKSKMAVIPEKEMITIIKDMHIADGTFMVSKRRSELMNADSVNYYDPIFEKYGYTRSQFDSSIAYYSTKPEILTKIYDQVLEELSVYEAEVEKKMKEKYVYNVDVNLFNDKVSWDLPQDGAQEKIDFNIPIEGTGTYSISAEIKMYEDDESTNPRITAYFFNDDGSRHGKRRYFPSTAIEKNNASNLYLITQVLTDTSFHELRGNILDHSNRVGNWKKHAEIRNIKVTYKKEIR